MIEVLDTQTFFALLKLPYPTDRPGVIDRLVQERIVDKAGDAYGIRRLGALLLARRLDDFPDLARKLPRVVGYTGASKLETRLDQSGTRGYAVGFQGPEYIHGPRAILRRRGTLGHSSSWWHWCSLNARTPPDVGVQAKSYSLSGAPDTSREA